MRQLIPLDISDNPQEQRQKGGSISNISTSRYWQQNSHALVQYLVHKPRTVGDL
ncbi:MAG: hypothetical protein HFP78_03475 [Methylococcales symbiont of Hymedesmia sp. n. MRB-2018]|nr:MAG: hypothetical protein HFP78_03475 [Methylococcales symbiont of Hymedesmia sp. n. MRB-2018]